jgi:lipoprotein-releasing system ATP-binding protein
MYPEEHCIVEVEGLRKIFKTGDVYLTVLDGLNLKVNRGDTVAIIGRSGSGKSTLLNLIGGLDKPTQGRVVIRGTHIEHSSEKELSEFRNRHIGFIFQFHHLLSEFTVIENVMMPYLIERFDIEKAYPKSLELLKILEIADKRDSKPNKLSGGESQRVAIARALMNAPEIILADEPTGNLDLKTGDIIKELLFGIVKKLGHTLIIVTHNRSIVEEADVTFQLEYGKLNNLLDFSN